MDNNTEQLKSLKYNPLKTSAESKRNIENIFKSKKTNRVITVTENDAYIESNLIEMPFVSYTKKKEVVTKVIRKWIDSKKTERAIVIEGNNEYGVPTAYEFDVIIALLKIFALKNRIEFNSEEFINQISKENLLIEFSLSEVAKTMGYNNNSGKTLNRIKRAIQILTKTTITSSFYDNLNKVKYSGGIYDEFNKKYIEGEDTFHIFNDYTSYSYKFNQRSPKNDIQKVYLGSFFYKSIRNSYFQFFKYDKYLSLTNSISKKIYLILYKWRNNRDFLELKFETLYQRIPLDDSIPNNEKKRTCKTAIKALVDAEYLESFETKDDLFKFIFKSESEEQTKNIKNYMNKYNRFAEIDNRLKEVGFNENEIKDFMDFIITNFNYVKALLRLTDVKIKMDTINNVKSFIYGGLLNKYQVEEKYYNS